MKLMPFLPLLAALLAAFFSAPASAQGVVNGGTYTNSNGSVTFWVGSDGQGGVWVQVTDASGSSSVVSGQGSGQNCTSAPGMRTPGGTSYHVSQGKGYSRSNKGKAGGKSKALRFVKKKGLKHRSGHRQTVLPQEDIGTLPLGTEGGKHGFAPFPF